MMIIILNAFAASAFNFRIYQKSSVKFTTNTIFTEKKPFATKLSDKIWTSVQHPWGNSPITKQVKWVELKEHFSDQLDWNDDITFMQEKCFTTTQYRLESPGNPYSHKEVLERLLTTIEGCYKFSSLSITKK
eukprot:NODE_1281_length_1447_cov_0.386499.p2 type:complete len:132 gc:universal NODE_1281_length_1447_cov_0.386499:1221-826(-)